MIITQVCNVLGRNEQVSSCFFEIKGYANRSIDGMEKHADDVRANLETALTDVLDVDVDVCATYGVGDDFPIIEHLISCNPKCKASDAYETFIPAKGKVTFVLFWASWCVPASLPIKTLNRLGADSIKD